jgi:hypothetical protein
VDHVACGLSIAPLTPRFYSGFKLIGVLAVRGGSSDANNGLIRAARKAKRRRATGCNAGFLTQRPAMHRHVGCVETSAPYI